jgi:tryptophan halogenase
LAFAHALPQARVELVETPDDPAALADRMPSTLPRSALFHARLGIDEVDLVRGGVAIHRLGTRFEKWSGDGTAWVHAFGEYGRPAGGIGFHDLWLRARRARKALAYDRYAAAAVLGEAARFVHPDDDPGSPLSTYVYGLQLDMPAYRRHLAQAATAAGVAVVRGTLATTERREDGGIEALVLEDGRRISAELFLDCAGPEGHLIGAVDPSYEGWDAWLPADRLLIGEAPDEKPRQTLDRAVAASAGWRWATPLPSGRAFGLAFRSDVTPDDRARRILTLEDGGEAAEAVAIRPGRRPRPWVRNVLVLGDAATAVDPLHGTNLSLAQSAIERAIALLPGRDCHPLELAEYNRRTELETLRVRDFLALHYLRSGRRTGAFWDGLSRRPLPSTLERTVEQFGERGRVPFFEEETFDKRSWIAVMIGLGLLPRHPGAMTGAVPAAEAERAMHALAEQLAALPRRLPSYPEYLARMGRR